jgi:hypothetical protein
VIRSPVVSFDSLWDIYHELREAMTHELPSNEVDRELESIVSINYDGDGIIDFPEILFNARPGGTPFSVGSNGAYYWPTSYLLIDLAPKLLNFGLLMMKLMRVKGWWGRMMMTMMMMMSTFPSLLTSLLWTEMSWMSLYNLFSNQ